MSHDTYIITDLEDDYTHVSGVFHEEHEAVREACLQLCKCASKPYTIKFYKRRDARFAYLIGIPEYCIEHWKDNRRLQTICVGHNIAKYHIDEYLKENHATIETILKDWLDQLNDGTIPEEINRHIDRI